MKHWIALKFLSLALLGSLLPTVYATEESKSDVICGIDVDWMRNDESCSNATTVKKFANGELLLAYNADTRICQGDYFLPLFDSETLWDKNVRIFVYFVALLWCFMGVAMISDIFMAAIEVITAKEVTIMKEDEKGEMKEFKTLYWNETVANLSLMALGSSAPEILLSVVETVNSLTDEAPKDGLGPSTIVGSAAYNLLVITGICILAIKDGDKRVIDQFGVFKVTAFFSMFAYIWMYIVINVHTPEEVGLLEAFATLLFFFALIGISYAADRNWFGYLSTTKQITPEGHVVGEQGTHSYSSHTIPHAVRKSMVAKMLKDGEAQKLKSPEELADFATNKLLEDTKVSRMRYRINAMRSITGGKRVLNAEKSASFTKGRSLFNLLPRIHTKRNLKDINETASSPRLKKVTFNFSTTRYDAFENEKCARIIVVREQQIGRPDEGEMEDEKFTIAYETSNGAAIAGEDYIYTSGTLEFSATEMEKVIEIPIIDDNQYEPNENFFVTLKNPSSNAKLGNAFVTEVMIIDDDDPGEFSFVSNAVVVKETDEECHLKIRRTNGTDGKVSIRFSTEDRSAKNGVDYYENVDVVVFQHGESEKEVSVKLINGNSYEKDNIFVGTFEILNFPDCGAKYGEHQHCAVTITSDERFQATIDQVTLLMQLSLESLEIGTNSWSDQIKAALEVEGEDGEDPNTMDYVMHVLTLFWKLLFATVPPTSYLGGWLTFVISLIYIGLMTMLVGDLASMFGCCLGVPNSTTAITFVALGTSLPDTFASKTAAIHDKYADASVGNVTGSNSVNVFLGLGLPWVIATIYHSINKTTYQIKADTLGYSVSVFCIVASLCISLLVFRRYMGWGELGGPKGPKLASALFCFALWGIYILLSILNNA